MTRSAPGLLLALCCLVTGPLTAQQPRLDISRLALGVDSMSIAFRRDSEGIPVGQLWDELAVRTTPAGPVLVRVFRTVNQAFGPHLDTTTSALPALVPVARRTSSRQIRDSLAVHEGLLSGWMEVGEGPRRTIARPLPPGTVDAGSFDLVVRMQDWVPAMRIEVPAYLSGQDTLLVLTARYGGRESLVQRDGVSAECWRIDGEFSTLVLTMWVDTGTRALVKEVIQLTPQYAMVMRR